MPNLVILKSKHYLVLFLISINLNHVLSEILVYKNTSSDNAVRIITDYELSIGSDIPDEGILAYIMTAQPENACDPISPPPKNPFNSFANDSRFSWFVLVDRDYCVMDKKLKNVKDAGFNGVIIYNAKLTQLNLPELDYQVVVDFPVLLVTHIDGKQIKKCYTYEKGYYALFMNNSPFKLYPFLLPFLIVIGACIIVIVSFMISQIMRCYNERRKRIRHRLAKHHLKKIPTINFKKGDHYEICAICLDEFQEGVKLRLLTCGHAYHLKCIDPWLTENRRNCPICKGKVVVPGITDSESENDTENQRNNNATERTPLLSNSSQTNENLVYSTNNLIFPIGRRTRRPGRAVSNAHQNNVPSTSNIVNNDESVIIVQNQRSGLFRSRRSNRRRGMMINAEINSPQSSTLNSIDQPSTSAVVVSFDDDSDQTNLSNQTTNQVINNQSNNITFVNTSNNSNSSTSNSSNNNSSATSQPSATSSGSAIIKSKRQDNNIV